MEGSSQNLTKRSVFDYSSQIFFLVYWQGRKFGFVVVFTLLLGGVIFSAPANSGRNKIHLEFFQTEDDAGEACLTFAHSLGYSNAVCGGRSTVNGGWWWSDEDSKSHYADFRYNSENISCPTSRAVSREVGNPVDCLSGAKIQKDNIYQAQGIDALALTTTYNSFRQIIKPGVTNSVPKNIFGAMRGANITRFVADIEALHSRDHTVYIRLGNGFSKIYWGSGSLGSSPKIMHAVDRNGDVVYLNSDYSLVEELSDGTRYSYDSDGKLLEKQFDDGRVHAYDYHSSGSGAGKVSSINNHFGSTIDFIYNAQDLVSEVIGSDNQNYYFEYDANDNLIKIIYPDGTPENLTDNPYKQYLFEDTTFPHALTGIIDENGERYSTWQYDSMGRAMLSVHVGNNDRVELDYSVAKQTTVKTFVDETRYSEKVYKYGYFSGLLKIYEVTTHLCTGCPAIKTESMEYSVNGDLASYIDAEGNETDYEIIDGLEINRTEASGSAEERSITTEWHPTLRLPSKITESDLETSTAYNSYGNPLTVTNKDLGNEEVRITQRTFNSFGQVLTLDGPRTDVSDITTFTYHSCATGFECGQVYTMTNALGHVTTFTHYNAAGQLTHFTDANGVQTVLTYDSRQRLISSTVDGQYVTQVDYDDVGQITRITSPNGSYIEYEYDGARRLKAMQDALGNRIEYTLDAAGNRTKIEVKDDAALLRNTQSANYDELNRVLQALGANGQDTSYVYDANDNPTSITELGKPSETNQYDALNRLIQETDSENGITQLSYDQRDRLETVTDPNGLTTTYQYNGFGDTIGIVSPDTGTTAYTVDEAGNILSNTDARGKISSFTYDALNRPLSATYADASLNITYSYDDTTNGNKGVGRLTGVVDSSGAHSYLYDARGLLTSVTTNTGLSSYTIAYTYDNSGQITNITYPSGRIIAYQYDNANRITTITSTKDGNTITLASNIGYRPFGPMTELTMGNGLTGSMSYDLDYRTDSLLDGNVMNRNYSYDTSDNITAITDNLQTSNSQTFSYDNLDRVINAIGGDGDWNYGYDATGNRTSLALDSTSSDSYAYAANTHRLSSISGSNPENYSYDAVGNRTSDQFGRRTFEYNDRGRLFKIYENGNLAATYTYNYLGQRTRKVTAGVTTVYHYDQSGNLISETDDAGNPIRDIVYRNSVPVAQIDSGVNDKITYLHTDHLGTPRRGTDDIGDVVWSWSGEAFGNTLANSDPDGDGIATIVNMRFPGQYYDAESGLHYNYFRYYDPQTGRYVTSDPIGLEGGLNTYAYVGGNPIKYTDPLGLHHIPFPDGKNCVGENGKRVKCPRDPCVTAECVNGDLPAPTDNRSNSQIECDSCVFECNLSMMIIPAGGLPLTLEAATINAAVRSSKAGICQSICRKECSEAKECK